MSLGDSFLISDLQWLFREPGLETDPMGPALGVAYMLWLFHSIGGL